MSDEFMIHVGMGSHARLVSEWAHYKSWAETSADEVESLRRQLAALRRGLQQLVGAPDVPALPDAELMIALGHALEKVDGDAPVERQVVGYGKPGEAPSLVVSVPAPVAPFAADFPVRALGESPWLAPPQDTERPRPDHVDDQLTYAKMQERGEVTLADGTQARFFADERPETGEQDGPATEAMPPVEEPPAVPDGYVLGRVFTRGDACPVDDELDLVVNRLGDVMRVFTEEESAGAVLRRDGSSVDWVDQLHMNGTLWEIVPSTGQAGEQVPGE